MIFSADCPWSIIGVADTAGQEVVTLVMGPGSIRCRSSGRWRSVARGTGADRISGRITDMTERAIEADRSDRPGQAGVTETAGGINGRGDIRAGVVVADVEVVRGGIVPAYLLTGRI